MEWYGGREVDEPIEAIAMASEMFLVSTTRDVQGISRWDDTAVTAPGSVTTEVAQVWRDREPELLGF
jgi:branched-chain amino acid aminotransferase